MTVEQLKAACLCPLERAAIWRDPLSAAMVEFDIKLPKRKAAFLAQIGHESGGLHFCRELWGPTPAQARYEGRKDLGNVKDGDGYKFRGRGLIQVTGRANYERMGKLLNLPLTDQPELLELYGNAARSAAAFWDSNALNHYADTDDFIGLTKRINGGLNGLADRVLRWNAAKSAFGIG